MWPWGHAVVGFLAYAAVTFGRRRRAPTTGETALVLLGTQVPDVVDKPLAWHLHVLPSGRSLAHSLLTAAVLVGLAAALANRCERPEATPAFGVGYLTHLLTDVPSEVLSGEFGGATFLLWPLLPAPRYGSEPSVTGHLLGIEPTPWFLAQAIAFLVVAGTWLAQRVCGSIAAAR